MSVPQRNSIEIEWDLSCPQAEALQKLTDSFENNVELGWYKIKGRVENCHFRIWTKTPGMRGHSIAVGQGQTTAKGDNNSHPAAFLTVLWPFYHFQLPGKLMISIVVLGVLSWYLSLAGAVSAKYEMLSSIFFLVGVICVLVIILSFIRYLGESELNDLTRFLEILFASHRQS
jgi:hypothetical protein